MNALKILLDAGFITIGYTLARVLGELSKAQPASLDPGPPTMHLFVVETPAGEDLSAVSLEMTPEQEMRFMQRSEMWEKNWP